jgi:hypothetical protein
VLVSQNEAVAGEIRLVVRGYTNGVYFVPSPMPKEKPLLKIKVTGPDLKPGHIPIPLLVRICGEAQKAINRQAEALSGKRSLRTGPPTAQVAQECTMDLVGLKKGSTTLHFVPAGPDQKALYPISIEAVSAVGEALKFVNRKRNNTPPPDVGVLDSLNHLGEVFGSGIDNLKWIVPAHNGTGQVTAQFNAKVLPKLKARLQPTLPLGPEATRKQFDSFEGTLELGEGKGRIVPAVGAPTLFNFGPEKAAAVLEATTKPVKAKLDPKTHKLRDIEVSSFGKGDFFASKTIDQLIAEQHVKPIADFSLFESLSDDDVDDLIAEIHQGRQG